MPIDDGNYHLFSHLVKQEMVNPILGTSMMMASNPERAGTHAASAGDITVCYLRLT